MYSTQDSTLFCFPHCWFDFCLHQGLCSLRWDTLDSLSSQNGSVDIVSAFCEWLAFNKYPTQILNGLFEINDHHLIIRKLLESFIYFEKKLKVFISNTENVFSPGPPPLRNFKFQLRYINPMEITSKFGDTIYLTTKSTSCLHIF